MRYAISTSVPQMYVGISVALKVISVHLQTIRCRKILYSIVQTNLVVGPCLHGMVCPQVADRGTTSDKEGSCE